MTTIRSKHDICANSAMFGQVLDVKSKVPMRLVKITEPEQIGNLTADPDQDYVLVDPNGKRRPIKKRIFETTYTPAGDDTYKKTAITQVVQVLEGTKARVISLETENDEDADIVVFPNYIAIGPEGEVYENKATWIEENLEILGTHHFAAK